jgi:hypothetical protein
MKFETEFNLNEHVWYMKNNTPTEVIISAIYIFEVGTNQSHIKYNAKNITNSVSWLDHQNIFQDALFKSKADLLRSLFGSDVICKGKKCSAIRGVGHSIECIAEYEAACGA